MNLLDYQHGYTDRFIQQTIYYAVSILSLTHRESNIQIHGNKLTIMDVKGIKNDGFLFFDS